MGAMTTVWRPRVRIAVENIDKVEEEAKSVTRVGSDSEPEPGPERHRERR